ncbi:MAG: globin [Chloroflexi bacterium]|nr:globin [Chloroflexota bacterium]
MAEITPDQIYDVIGRAGFEKLVEGFYRRVASDDLLRPMYPEADLKPAQHRLQLFLEQYFGGPTTYAEQRGHPRLRMRHAYFKIDQSARDRWVEHMTAALDEAEFAPEVTAVMRDYFENGASFLMNT